MIRAGISNGCIALMVDLNADVSIDDFIGRLKSWTSAWIVTERGTGGAKPQYWMSESYFCAVSPEDKDTAVALTESLPRAHGYDVTATGCRKRVTSVCHHIIIITSRSRLLIPLKYRILLSEIISDVATDLGIEVVASSAMRNHVHILCNVPTRTCVSNIINSLRDRLLEAMHRNGHFGKVGGWSDDALVYTVSDNRKAEEEHIVLTQDMIHRPYNTPNEMAHISSKLDIAYTTSLH